MARFDPSTGFFSLNHEKVVIDESKFLDLFHKRLKTLLLTEYFSTSGFKQSVKPIIESDLLSVNSNFIHCDII